MLFLHSLQKALPHLSHKAQISLQHALIIFKINYLHNDFSTLEHISLQHASRCILYKTLFPLSHIAQKYLQQVFRYTLYKMLLPHLSHSPNIFTTCFQIHSLQHASPTLESYSPLQCVFKCILYTMLLPHLSHIAQNSLDHEIFNFLLHNDMSNFEQLLLGLDLTFCLQNAWCRVNP